MKNHIHTYIMNKIQSTLLTSGLFFSALTLLGSCAQDNPWGDDNGSGRIVPRLSASADVIGSGGQRQAVETLEAPAVENFGLTLEKSDGTYQKTWNSFNSFPTDEKFKVGHYTMSAFYGSLDEEGFERPYYYGEETFSVKEDETENVSITARLANSMVSISYTEAFLTYFKDFSSTIHSPGGAYIVVPKEETRPAYLKPGEVTVAVSLTKQNGVSATFQPASFTAEARHHYRITLDVNNGEVGEAQLVVIFDDSVEEENVTIDLSDEVMTAPAPEVSPRGFTPGTPLEVLELSQLSEPAKFFIRARSGISAATLTLNSSYSIPLGSEFDICALNDLQLAQLREAGIDETGLSRQPGTLAELNLSRLIGKLPTGTHRFTLVVKDKLTKVNEPVELTVVASPLTLQLVSVSPVLVGNTDASIVVSYNGTNLVDNLTIEAYDDYGALVNCPIKSVTQKTGRRSSFAAKDYTVQFTIPESNREVGFIVKYAGVKKIEGTINRSQPSYSFKVDAFAHYALIGVEPDNSGDLASITSALRVFAGNTELEVVRRDTSKGTVMVGGLQPQTTYSFYTTTISGTSPTLSSPVNATTETVTGVPNGDFENLVQTFNVQALEQGGKYTRTLISSEMQNHQRCVVSEPQGWASTNAKTANTSASTQNSWFVLPSVYNTGLDFLSTVAKQGGMGGQTGVPDIYKYVAQSGANAMVVRNVAYDPAGTLPSVDKKTAVPDGYYNRNIPSIANRAAGKLFLGSYSYSGGSETYNEGISFSSRPTALEGYYHFTNDGNDTAEKATVTVTLLGGGTVLGTATATLDAVAGFTKFRLPVVYSVFFKKADTLRIMISSSNHAGTISHETAQIKTTGRAQLMLQESTGAVLVVDNLSFTY